MERLRPDPVARIAKAVTAVGSEGFPEALACLCFCLTNCDSLFISLFSQGNPPRQLYSNLNAEATRRTVGPYLSYAYLLDPFHELFKSGIGTKVVSLNECAPDDFRSSEYYHEFYSEIGLRNEVSAFVDAGQGSSIVLSLGQRGAGTGQAMVPMAELADLLPVIAALCTRHWPNAAADPGAGNPQVSLAFERFQAGKLSPREGEIVQLMLKGHSTKSIARLLGNSPETVKMHRKRIYAKLEISSQGELFSMLMGTLVSAQPEKNAGVLMPPALGAGG